MLTHIQWTDGALDDLERLRDFLVSKNPEAARRAATVLIRATELLEQNPQAGTSVEDMFNDGDYRDLFIPFGAYGYLMRYRYERDSVYILHIRHTREEEYKNLPRT